MSATSFGDDERYGAALAGLGTGHAWLYRLLDGFAPADAWDAVVAGRHPADPDHRLRRQATSERVARIESACVALGVSVSVLGVTAYPEVLAADHQAPPVLFSIGDPTPLVSWPRVAVVGTRSATAYGLGVASELGQRLSEAGVVVVSGLARGIDAAVHAGALRASAATPLLGVPGGPFDGRRPPSLAALAQAVGTRGALVGEQPPGTSPPRWAFAARNRIMAAASHAVVVVEAHRRSGSLHTVAAADARGVRVGAVPGSVRSPASAGTNELLATGTVPAYRDVEDVLAAVEATIAPTPSIRRPVRSVTPKRRRQTKVAGPSPLADHVRRALADEPASLEQIVVRCGRPLAEVALGLEQLLAADLAQESRGWWALPSR